MQAVRCGLSLTLLRLQLRPHSPRSTSIPLLKRQLAVQVVQSFRCSRQSIVIVREDGKQTEPEPEEHTLVMCLRCERS